MILLRNCFYVMTAPGKGLSNVDILIKDNLIEKVGRNLSEDPLVKTGRDVIEVIDASKHVVIPGMVNTHHHFYQTLTRNLPAVQNAELFDWLVYLYDIWKKLDAEGVYWSTALATAELLKTGCTTTTDHHYLYPRDIHADIMALQFKAAGDTGIRFSPTRGSMSRSKKDGGLPPDSVVQTEDEILADSERVINEFHDASDFSMQKIVLAPCSPFSVSEELMKQSAALARRKGVRLHTHLAETRDENEYCLEMYKRRPVKLMEDCDFLGEDVFFAHGIHFNDDELKVLKETGSHIAHCPASNMRLGSGICRVREMNDLGINVGLAVDGSASNDASDMLGEARLALLLQRVTKGADALTAEEVYRMAGINGAQMLGYNKIGKIEEGWAADLALFDVHKLEYCGALSDPAAALLFSGYNHGTDYTICNGKIVVEKGQLTGIDEEILIAEAGKAAGRLYGRDL
ncbi:MAG: 8-oxoguanine deaminase [Spirochaetales bacterium]|nr:8-oxoguanine deaminase [Spirochaetales bacterium]